MSDAPLTIDCGIHGPRKTAVVCCHMLQERNASVGFVENSSDPDDLQAWCDDCETMFLREQDKTEAFLAFNDFAVVCVDCYVRLKAQHSTSTPRGRT